jgi:hypothetical protein
MHEELLVSFYPAEETGYAIPHTHRGMPPEIACGFTNVTYKQSLISGSPVRTLDFYRTAE